MKASTRGERSAGLRGLLSSAAVYRRFQRLAGSHRFRAALTTALEPLAPGVSVLDVGCGPGGLRRLLPADVRYTGFDPNPGYIATARAELGEAVTLHVAGVEEVDADALGTFDVVVAKGVLHHLDDVQAAELFRLARRVLHVDGRLLCVDPVYEPGQSRLARAIISRDRGRHVRTVEGYRRLASAEFGVVRTEVRRNLLRIPYSHVFITCRQGPSTGR